MRELIDYPIGLVLIVLFITITIIAAILCGITNFLTFEADEARIEQLRIATTTAKWGENEDILGQVVETNQQIITNQTYNRKWWAGWAIPDGWDLIPLINIEEVPTR